MKQDQHKGERRHFKRGQHYGGQRYFWCTRRVALETSLEVNARKLGDVELPLQCPHQPKFLHANGILKQII